MKHSETFNSVDKKIVYLSLTDCSFLFTQYNILPTPVVAVHLVTGYWQCDTAPIRGPGLQSSNQLLHPWHTGTQTHWRLNHHFQLKICPFPSQSIIHFQFQYSLLSPSLKTLCAQRENYIQSSLIILVSLPAMVNCINIEQKGQKR